MEQAYVFSGSGSTFTTQHGVVTEVDKKSLRDLNGPLPEGMFARYVVTTTEHGTSVVEGVMQGHSACGRRYFADLNESAAQRRILKWAQRVLRVTASVAPMGTR